MLQNLTGWHALVILTIVLLVFGSAKLPALARSVGQSMRILKDEVHDHAATTTSPVEPVEPVESVAERRAS
jgi:sec-independent protein translocase protein TatA